ncbi:MAG: DNA recombination protein RmuC [Moraxellaceae bacterium]
MNSFVVITALAAFLLGGVLVYFWLAAGLRRRDAELRGQGDALQQRAVDQARLEEQLLAYSRQEKQAETLRAELELKSRELEQQLRQRDVHLKELQTRLEVEREQLLAQARLVKEQEQTLKLQFEQLATKIFEEKSQKFSEQNKIGLDGLLTPLREQLKDFREKVESTYSNEARERFALKEQIVRLEGLNRQISDDASNLAKALKGDKKLQGNWGELILTRVLEESGLHEGREYVTQFSTRNDEGRLLIPDAIVRLPEGRDIVIDSKVSLNDYVRYCESSDEEERQQLLKLHTTAVRNHIKALSEKRYEDLPELRTLDFVFLFMPVEAAFMLAVEHDKALFTEAFDKKIIIVSPTTLLATLRTVESIWRYERQNQNAEKIAKEAGGLHDKFVTLLSHLDDLGRAMDRSQESYRKTISGLSGHGGLMGRVENLKKLGAKAKKSLPGSVGRIESDVADDNDEADSEDANT